MTFPAKESPALYMGECIVVGGGFCLDRLVVSTHIIHTSSSPDYRYTVKPTPHLISGKHTHTLIHCPLSLNSYPIQTKPQRTQSSFPFSAHQELEAIRNEDPALDLLSVRFIASVWHLPRWLRHRRL